MRKVKKEHMNTQKAEIIVLVGIPASGKTTWAKALIEKCPDKYVYVNRDSIRLCTGTYEHTEKREKLINVIEKTMINDSLRRGFNVIVDSTNISMKGIRHWEIETDSISSSRKNHVDVTLKIKTFDVSLMKSIYRNMKRWISGGHYVPVKAIKTFLCRYRQLIENEEFIEKMTLYEYNN